MSEGIAEALERYWGERGPGPIKAAAESKARVTGTLGAVIHHLGLIGRGTIDPWALLGQESCVPNLRKEAPT